MIQAIYCIIFQNSVYNILFFVFSTRSIVFLPSTQYLVFQAKPKSLKCCCSRLHSRKSIFKISITNCQNISMSPGLSIHKANNQGVLLASVKSTAYGNPARRLSWVPWLQLAVSSPERYPVCVWYKKPWQYRDMRIIARIFWKLISVIS